VSKNGGVMGSAVAAVEALLRELLLETAVIELLLELSQLSNGNRGCLYLGLLHASINPIGKSIPKPPQFSN
jgi:hypothetical protein